MTHAHLPSLAQRNGFDIGDCLVGALQDRTRFGKEDFARFRKTHAFGAAVEEAHRKLFLQIANLSAEWWLRYVETRGRSRDAL
jgi:hypothetical protein